MRLARPLLLLMSIALALPVAAFAADQYVPLQQRMSPEEFKAAGLDKLSPDELKNLDNWLSGHGKVVTKVVDQAGKPVFYPTSGKPLGNGRLIVNAAAEVFEFPVEVETPQRAAR